jgi:hypothetical protein
MLHVAANIASRPLFLRRCNVNELLFNADKARAGTKKCTHCKEIKSTEEFSKHSQRADGLQSWCKECVSRDSHKPKAKICPRCRRLLPFESFSVDRTRKDGRRRECKECLAQYYKEYRIRLREQATPTEPTTATTIDPPLLKLAALHNALAKRYTALEAWCIEMGYTPDGSDAR